MRKSTLPIAVIAFCILVVGGVYFTLTRIAAPATYVAPEDSTSVVAKDPLKVLFVGDIMVGRNVENLMRERGDEYPFVYIRDFMFQFDYAVGNLEGPIPSRHVQTPSMSFRFSFVSSTPRVLRENNITVVSLANNHTYDHGKEEYNHTIRLLEQEGVSYTGHPVYADESSVLSRDTRGKQLAYIGFNATFPSFVLEDAAAVVREAREVRKDTLIIVLIHWGDEYGLVANKTQRTIAETLALAGADIIIGHHPHVVQDIDIVQGVPVFYSLGNFIFDQYFSKDVKEGLTIGLEASDQNLKFTLYPIESERSQPVLMEAEKREKWLGDLARRSSAQLQESITAGSITIERAR